MLDSTDKVNGGDIMVTASKSNVAPANPSVHKCSASKHNNQQNICESGFDFENYVKKVDKLLDRLDEKNTVVAPPLQNQVNNEKLIEMLKKQQLFNTKCQQCCGCRDNNGCNIFFLTELIQETESGNLRKIDDYFEKIKNDYFMYNHYKTKINALSQMAVKCDDADNCTVCKLLKINEISDTINILKARILLMDLSGNGLNNLLGMRMPFNPFSNDFFKQQGTGNVSQSNAFGSIPLPNTEMKNQMDPMDLYMQFFMQKSVIENMFRQ